jgi:hypothetical protein
MRIVVQDRTARTGMHVVKHGRAAEGHIEVFQIHTAVFLAALATVRRASASLSPACTAATTRSSRSLWPASAARQAAQNRPLFLLPSCWDV